MSQSHRREHLEDAAQRSSTTATNISKLYYKNKINQKQLSLYDSYARKMH